MVRLPNGNGSVQLEFQVLFMLKISAVNPIATNVIAVESPTATFS
jgi:hypothetical protein